MIGYWTGGRRPFSTTANNFFENYNFLTPMSGLLIWVLIIGIPIAMLSNIVNPTTEYRFSDYHNHLVIKYQSNGDNVTGHLEYIWDEYDKNYTVNTDFTGKITGNNLMIELQDNNIRTYVGPQGTISKIINMDISNNKINFQGLLAEKI